MTLPSSAKIAFTIAGFLAFFILGGFIFSSCSARYHQTEITRLRNTLAQTDKTLEATRGVYTRLLVESRDVLGSLDSKDRQISELKKILEEEHSKVLSSTQTIIKWKTSYRQAAQATQTPNVPATAGAPERKRVQFDKEFPLVKVSGWTLTDPAEAWIEVSQPRPIKLTTVVTQQQDGSWRSYATSSEDDISVDIGVSAVNPYALERRWYENVGISVDLGGGSNSSGAGALAGLGLDYSFSNYSLGPHAWLGINDRVDRYFGVQFQWRPFQRKR